VYSHSIRVITPFVDGFVPKKANKYRETRVEVTFKNSAGRPGVAPFGFAAARKSDGGWEEKLRGGRVAVLYEQASHKLSRLFKKLEKGASASRGTACVEKAD